MTKVYTVDLGGGGVGENADVYVKMTKYVGKGRVRVAATREFDGNQVIEGDSTMTVTQIALTPNTRRDFGFKEKFYVEVYGNFDTTYMLQTTIETKNYTLLDD